MPNTVLGKVSCVPRGDYSASETYYALDIVGHEGGSYLAMKEVTGVTPSNDQVNWMQLSGPGLPGADGVTFTPSVSEAGEISWTNDGEKENPEPVDIMGPPGAAAGFGTVTATADNTSSETPSVDVQASGPDTAKNFAFAFSGLKGNPGETPDITVGTVTTLEPGQDATAEITGTTPDLVLSLGLPKGQPGTSVSRIQRTDGTGAAGTTDTYTMYDSNDDAIGTFTVYNGANGSGAGDLMADGSVPMTGALNMGGNKVTNLGAPGADTDAVRKSDLDAVAAEVDGILDGTTPAHLAPATEAKIGGVIIGEGLSVTEDGTVSADDQLPTGGTQGQVLTQGATGPAWQDAPSGLPDGGTPGQVLTQGASGPEWTDAPDPLPTGGTDGQVLTKTTDGATWKNVPSEIPAGGTTGQVLTKGESGPEWGDKPVMYVHITLNGGTYNADKTFSEIYQAYQDGCALFAVADWDSDIPVMSLNTVVPSGFVAFSSYYYGTYFFFSVYPNSVLYGTDLVGANRVSFTPGTTGLTSDNVQGAIEEVNAKIPAKPKSVSVTLSASGWASNSQTVTVQGVKTSGQSVRISPATKTDADNWVAAGVWCSEPTTANQLVFTCDTAPTENININVELQEVQS